VDGERKNGTDMDGGGNGVVWVIRVVWPTDQGQEKELDYFGVWPIYG
jgi:hypothetical protein